MKKALMAAALTTFLVAGPASAQMYLGAGVGSAKTDTRQTSWKLYGGYQFSPVWGMELGYTDLGKYRGADARSWSLAGTGTMALNENWSVLGKLGAASNRSDFPGAGNHTALLAGVGVGLKLTKEVGLRLEYEDFGKLSDVAGGNNVRGRNLGLSVKYAF